MRSEDTANTLIVFSGSLPDDSDAPVSVMLDQTVTAVHDDITMNVREISVVPRLDARSMVKFLTSHFNRAENVISFDGLMIALDDAVDSKLRQIVMRLASKPDVGVIAVDGFQPTHNSVLDVVTSHAYADHEIDFDTSLFATWVATKSVPVEEEGVSSEEQIESQLMNLLGEDLFSDDDDDDDDDSHHSGDKVNLPHGRELKPEPKNEPTFEASETDAPDGDDEEEEGELFDPSSGLDELLPEVHRASDKPIAESASEEATEDDVMSVPVRASRESRPREDVRSSRDDTDGRDGEKWSTDEQDTRVMHALKESVRETRAREDAPHDRQSPQPTEKPASRSESKDELLNEVAEETPAFEVSQYDMLSRDADEQNTRLNNDAYIDTSLDADEDKESSTLHAAEATFDVNTSSPAFLERKREENERTRGFVEERLLPDPEKYSDFDEVFDQISTQDLSKQGDGLPKEGAPSGAPVSPKPTVRDARRDDDSVDGFDDSAIFGFDEEEDDDEEEYLSPVGFQYNQEQQLHNTYQAVRAVRNERTRVLSVSGPSGGSGKTTTSYGLFIASGRVDHAFSTSGRGKQLTWLIELDVMNSKWAARSHLDESGTLVGLIKEFDHRQGNVSSKELIQLALRHSSAIIENHPNSRLLAAPRSIDYKDSLTIEKTYLVLERVIDAIARDKEHASTIILDFPDYAGENLDPRLAKIMNTYSDNIVICFPDNGNEDDLVTIISLISQQIKNVVELSRVSIVGTRRTRIQAEKIRAFANSNQINYAGTIPRFAELGESDTQWIAHRSAHLQKQLTLFCVRILKETGINPMAESWLNYITTKMKRSSESPSRSGGSSSGGDPRKKSSSSAKKRSSGGVKSQQRKSSSTKSNSSKQKKKGSKEQKKPGWKKILGLD